MTGFNSKTVRIIEKNKIVFTNSAPPPILIRSESVDLSMSDENLDKIESLGWSKEDITILSTVIYFEAGPRASLEAAEAVGLVVFNRLRAGYGENIRDIVFAPYQFTVTRNRKFKVKMKSILNDEDSFISNTAALGILLNNSELELPDDVLYFHTERQDKSWGNRSFYATFGGNDFFKRG